MNTFPTDYVISLCSVVVRCSCVEPKVQSSSPTELFFSLFLFFSVFSVVVFYKYIACIEGVFLGGQNLVRVCNIFVAAIFDFMTAEDWGE